jgi:hypothetical protein
MTLIPETCIMIIIFIISQFHKLIMQAATISLLCHIKLQENNHMMQFKAIAEA